MTVTVGTDVDPERGHDIDPPSDRATGLLPATRREIRVRWFMVAMGVASVGGFWIAVAMGGGILTVAGAAGLPGLVAGTLSRFGSRSRIEAFASVLLGMLGTLVAFIVVVFAFAIAGGGHGIDVTLKDIPSVVMFVGSVVFSMTVFMAVPAVTIGFGFGALVGRLFGR